MITDIDVAKKLISIHNSADSRKITCTLSIKKVRRLLLQKRCYYTNIAFTEDPNSNFYRTLDRVDSKGGYTDDNVVACTKIINGLKANITIKEAIAIADGMRKFEKLNKKNNTNLNVVI